MLLAPSFTTPYHLLLTLLLPQVMANPVICADGHSYERGSIERWLAAHGTSPLTGRALPHKELTPNHRLRSVIQELQQSRELR